MSALRSTKDLKDMVENSRKITFSNTYSGNFENDYLNGLGKWKYANGDIAEGNFKDDSIDGFAIYIWANGDKYEGNWVKGYREGKGKYTYKNGNIYEGEYLNNKS